MKLTVKAIGFPLYIKSNFSVWKVITTITFFLIITVFYSCNEEDETDISKIVGKWKVVDSSDGELAYMIFTSDNYYHLLFSRVRNQHEVQSGVFIKSGTFLDLDKLNANFVIIYNSDSLILDHPTYKVTCIRDTLAPDTDEWLIPIEVVQEIPLSFMTYKVSDMAHDGNNLWISFNKKVLYKLDNEGNFIDKVTIDNSGGLAYGNGYLWTGENDNYKICRIDASNKDNIRKYSINGYMVFTQLAYQPGYIWAFALHKFKLLKLNENNWKIEAEFESDQLDGLTYANGQLWAVDENYLFTVDTLTGSYIDSYKIENGYYPDGLTFDGNNFWASEYNSGKETNRIYKLELN
ncbi:MAG: hypothetical protein JW798_03925 [Prolixibacteraceae bacterium]|nr:hypothetical protein [Prolixibacteraceae bacterium]